MNRRQLTFGGAGFAALIVGFGLSTSGVVSTLVDVAGSDYLFVAALGGMTLLATVPVVVSARSTTLQQSTTSDPELPVDSPPAGREFDETVRSARFRLPVVGHEVRTRVRERLGTAAVEATMRATDCDRDTATRRVQTGRWTDDSAASVYLASDPPLQRRIETALDAVTCLQTPTQRRAERTAEAISTLEREP